MSALTEDRAEFIDLGLMDKPSPHNPAVCQRMIRDRVEKNEEDTLANNVSPFNARRILDYLNDPTRPTRQMSDTEKWWRGIE